MQDREVTAGVLRMVRADLSLSQPKRVEELLRHGDPARVIAENQNPLLFSQDDTEKLLNQWVSQGITVTTILDASYPETLRGIREAPAVLFSTGTTVAHETGVSIVGSRDAPEGALSAAAMVSRALAEFEVPVISGLAAGIDTAAHEAALAAGGRTVAFIGTGILHTYPTANKDLRRRVESGGGAVYSQFLPDQRGSRQSFPMRNAVMSGYGAATLVIAAEEKSGTRHQVKAAVRHGRDVILSGKVATETSWGRDLVELGRATAASSTEEAVALAVSAVRRSQRELTLFA